ncbi:MAG: tetratricopeptide (TPR) repeat protein [Pseudohongiellaceae bacterium]
MVPLCVDPYGDTLALKKLALGILGSAALALEAFEVLVLRRQLLAPTVAEWLLGALGLWGAFSLLWAANPALGWVGVGVLFGMLGVTRGLRQSLSEKGSLRGWIAAVLGVGLVAFVVDGVVVAREGVELQLAARKHASWLFEHNNMAANYAAALAPLAAAMAIVARSWRGRVMGCLLVAGVFAYQVLLHSRAGLASTVLGVAVTCLLIVVRQRLRRPGKRAAVVLTVLSVVFAVLPSSDGARGLAKEAFYSGVRVLEELEIGDIADASFRPGIYRRTMELVAEAPIRGVGLGNFPVGYSRFDPRAVEIPHAHNDSLQILAELGLVGLLLFLGLMSAVLWQVCAGLSAEAAGGEGPVPESVRRSVMWAAGLGGAVTVFIVGGLFEVPFALGDTAGNFALFMAFSGRLAGAAKPLSAGAMQLPAGGLKLLSTTALALFATLTGLLVMRLPASSLYEQAQRARQLGQVDAARRALTALAEIRTGMHVPYLQLGQLAEELGDWPTALEHFQSALRLWPHSLSLLELEAEALIKLGRSAEAVEVYEQAVALTPTDRAVQARLVLFLAQAGRLPEAIDRVTYRLQSRPVDSTEFVAFLARLHLRQSERLLGDEQVLAWIASRHFYAVLLQDGSPDTLPEWNREFRHMTHQLQSLPGAPESWWSVYDEFRAGGGWGLPSAALWTAVDGEGEELFPGWDEVAGPPVPRSFR